MNDKCKNCPKELNNKRRILEGNQHLYFQSLEQINECLECNMKKIERFLNDKKRQVLLTNKIPIV